METSKYDRFYFLPLEDDYEGLKFSFFELKESDQARRLKEIQLVMCIIL